MTWQEHEKEYCVEIEPRPQDIWDTFDSYCESVNSTDKEQQHEESFGYCFKTVRWQGKYYAVMRLSQEAEDYYD